MMIALLTLFSLVALAVAAFGVIRFDRARKLRDERARWADIALVLDAELRVGENGRPTVHGRRAEVEWELRTNYDFFGRPGLEVTFDAADRLAPATVWREPPDDVEHLERLGSEEFRTVFQVEQGRLDAGCVRWLDDRETQDLLLAIHPFAASVISGIEARNPKVWLILDELDLEGIRLAIEWSVRMSRLAREGQAALPPH